MSRPPPLLLCLLPLAGLRAAPARAEDPPKPLVTILCGAPGDAEHQAKFALRLEVIRRTLSSRFGLAAEDMKIFAGSASEGPQEPASLANVKKACAATTEARKTGRAAWLIYIGHANEAPGDMRLNLPGDDLSGKELADFLKTESEPSGPLNVILTSACSGRALRYFAGPGRAVMAATNPVEGYDETVFPDGVLKALESPEADANQDDRLSMTEIFLIARAHTDGVYRAGGFFKTEHPILDGDGDGRGTQRPAELDRDSGDAPGHSLKIHSSTDPSP